MADSWPFNGEQRPAWPVFGVQHFGRHGVTNCHYAAANINRRRGLHACFDDGDNRHGFGYAGFCA
jgi:hypothetical protein